MGSKSTAASTEERLTKLKAELGITDAQIAAWKGYVDAAKAQATAMKGQHEKMMMHSGSIPARMDAHITGMEICSVQ